MFGARGNDVVIVVSFWINRRVICMVYRLSDNQICGATSSKVSRECCGSTLKKMNSTNVMACVTHLHSGPFLEPLVMYRWSLCSTFPSRCLLPGGLSFDLGMDGWPHGYKWSSCQTQSLSLYTLNIPQKRTILHHQFSGWCVSFQGPDFPYFPARAGCDKFG